jgi:hypothetical protein
MTTISQDVMVVDLRELRSRAHGTLHVRLSFECQNYGRCPVKRLQVDAVEHPGAKPIQPRMVCPRCREPLVYVGCDPR